MGGPSSGMAHSSAAKRRLRRLVRAVFGREVSGRNISPSVMEIGAMRDDGPPSGRRSPSGLARAKFEHFCALFTLIVT
jgi:hypothetical protein